MCDLIQPFYFVAYAEVKLEIQPHWLLFLQEGCCFGMNLLACSEKSDWDVSKAVLCRSRQIVVMIAFALDRFGESERCGVDVFSQLQG